MIDYSLPKSLTTYPPSLPSQHMEQPQPPFPYWENVKLTLLYSLLWFVLYKRNETALDLQLCLNHNYRRTAVMSMFYRDAKNSPSTNGVFS